MKKSYEIDMCNGPLFKNILLFALPLVLTGILQLAFNTADLIVVGQFAGDSSFAAVGATSTLISLTVNVFIGLSVGANVVAARYFGAKKDKEVNETVHTAVFLSLIFGVFIAIFGIIFAEYFLKLMSTPKNIIDKSALYLRIYFGGMPVIMLYNFGSAIMRVNGDTRRPLFYLITAGIINVILNLILVIVFKMDVAGVAIATVTSNAISAFLIIRHLRMETNSLKLEIKKIRFHKDKALQIALIGLPAGFQSMVFAFSNVIIQSSINKFGEMAIVGNTAASSVENFIYTSMNSFHHSALTFTSQNIGAGKLERIKKILGACLLIVCLTWLLLAIIVLPLGENLLHIYTGNKEAIKYGMERIYIIVSLYFICGIMDVLSGSIRGMGYSITPMIISLIGACGLRLLLIYTFFQIEKFHTLRVLYSFYPLSWTLTIIALIGAYIISHKLVYKKYHSPINSK